MAADQKGASELSYACLTSISQIHALSVEISQLGTAIANSSTSQREVEARIALRSVVGGGPEQEIRQLAYPH